jgi:ABC-type dipeptide/oligopeptide/nickel transport system ATPase component
VHPLRNATSVEFIVHSLKAVESVSQCFITVLYTGMNLSDKRIRKVLHDTKKIYEWN